MIRRILVLSRSGAQGLDRPPVPGAGDGEAAELHRVTPMKPLTAEDLSLLSAEFAAWRQAVESRDGGSASAAWFAWTDTATDLMPALLILTIAGLAALDLDAAEYAHDPRKAETALAVWSADVALKRRLDEYRKATGTELPPLPPV